MSHPPHMLNRYRQRKMISGHGVTHKLIEYGKHGVKEIKQHVLHGLKTLVKKSIDHAERHGHELVKHVSEKARKTVGSGNSVGNSFNQGLQVHNLDAMQGRGLTPADKRRIYSEIYGSMDK